MAPFFRSSLLFALPRRRHTHKPESNPLQNSFASSPPPALHSHSLPNLEDLRGLSVTFFEELSPFLQSRPVGSPTSPVLSPHVSLLSPGGSSKAQNASACFDVTVGPHSSTTITTLGLVTSPSNQALASPVLSSCSSLATVRATEIAHRTTVNTSSIEVSLGDPDAVQMNEDDTMLCEMENGSDEKMISLDVPIAPDDCVYHERLISDMRDELYGLKDAYWALQDEEQTLVNVNRALLVQNEKLNKELASNDNFKLLQRLDDQIAELKHAIDHIISTEMDVTVLRVANHAVQRGADASNALFLAMRITASNAPDGDPWKTIMDPQQIDYSHEEHSAVIKQNAELSDEIHLVDKKYRLWKVKAQMNAKYAGYITPSSSALSLLLNSLEKAPKKWPENVNNILDKFDDGYEIKMRAMVSSVPAPGPSGCQRSPSAEVHLTASPVPTNTISPIANSNNDVLPPEHPQAVLSPALSLELAEAVLSPALSLESVEVVLSPARSFEAAGASSSPAPSLGPAEPVSSTALSVVASIDTIEEQVQVIRRYIPGLKLFGGDGLGPAPPGLFGPPSDPEDELVSPKQSERVISQESSPGLEYIDEYSPEGRQDVVLIEQHSAESSLNFECNDEFPADGRRNPILLESDDSSSEFLAPLTFIYQEQTNTPIPVLGNNPPSHSVVHDVIIDNLGDSSCERIDDCPVDGRCNPVFRDRGDRSIEEIPRINSFSSPERIDKYNTSRPRNPILRDGSYSTQFLMVVPSSKQGKLGQPEDKSILSTIASSSISNLKRLSLASSSIKRSISGGLKRLRQMTFTPRKKDNPAPASSRPPLSHQRQMPSVHGKENKNPQTKQRRIDSRNKPIISRQKTPAPPKRVQRPTISSALKTVKDSQPISPSRPPKAVKQKNVEPPAQRLPFTDVASRPLTKTPLSTHQKVMNQGRKAVRDIVRLVS